MLRIQQILTASKAAKARFGIYYCFARAYQDAVAEFSRRLSHYLKNRRDGRQAIDKMLGAIEEGSRNMLDQYAIQASSCAVECSPGAYEYVLMLQELCDDYLSRIEQGLLREPESLQCSRQE